MTDCPHREKQAYATLSQARDAAARFRRRTGERIEAYECKSSTTHYHTGHAAADRRAS